MNSKKIGLILGMKANELRIGNLVSYRGETKCVVNSLGSNGFETKDLEIFGLTYGSDDINDYDPIPITEEWLFRFGFEKNKTDLSDYEYLKCISGSEFISWFKDGSCCIGGSYDEIQKGICYCSDAIITHVHQLQNLYFALTGEELKLNEI